MVLSWVQAGGYELLKSKWAGAARRIWLEAWNGVMRLLDRAGIVPIEEFDEGFRGTQSLFNWIQGVEGELRKCGPRRSAVSTARIVLCEGGVAFSQLIRIRWSRTGDVDGEYFELGGVERAETLFRD